VGMVVRRLRVLAAEEATRPGRGGGEARSGGGRVSTSLPLSSLTPMAGADLGIESTEVSSLGDRVISVNEQ
jgi:hypothetical protein